MGRNQGCGGIIVTFTLFLGVPALVYGFICWVSHWMEIYQL